MYIEIHAVFIFIGVCVRKLHKEYDKKVCNYKDNKHDNFHSLPPLLSGTWFHL